MEHDFMDAKPFDYYAEAVCKCLNRIAPDMYVKYMETSGEILTDREDVADAIADLIEASGQFDYVNTSYYDPEEDERDGVKDEYTGKWCVTID